MKSAPVLVGEAERMTAVLRSDLLDTHDEAEFDEITQLAAHICEVPIALMSIIDTDRQWFKSRFGIAARETPRDISFCGHAIASDAVFEVRNALEDSRFFDNPLVTGDPNIRFYAGAPLLADDGCRLGTLCVIDRVPRTLSAQQRGALTILGRRISREIQARRALRELEASLAVNAVVQAQLRESKAFLETLVDALPIGVFAKKPRDDGAWEFMLWNRAAEAISGHAAADVLGKVSDALFPADLARVYAACEAQVAIERRPADVPLHRIVRADGQQRLAHTTAVPILDAQGRVSCILGMSQDVTDAMRQGEELQKKQAELLAVADASPLGMFRTDALGHCVYVNRKYEEITGMRAAQAHGDGWIGGLHPEDRERVLHARSLARISHTEFSDERRFVRPDGTTVLCRVLAAPMRVDGAFSGFVGTVDDITDRRQVRDALRLSEQRLRLLTESLPALIGHVDAQQRFLFANGPLCSAMGAPAAAIVGRSMQAVLPPAQYAHVRPYAERALRGEEVRFDSVMGTGDAVRQLDVTYVPDHNGQQVVGFFAMASDVTERKRSEAVKAADDLRLRLLADNLPMLITYIDAERRVRFSNRMMHAWMGITPEAAQGLHFADIVGAKLYGQRKAYIDRALAGERVEFAFESDTLGVQRHMQAVYIPDRARDGSILGFYTLTTDVSTLKQSEKQLSQLAHFDTLTGLPNRLLLNQELQNALARNKGRQTAVAVMFLDIDRFKLVNDVHGHGAGDCVLVEFARRLEGCVRSNDIVARLAGDEFIIVLDALTSAAQPALVAQKVLTAMCAPFVLEGGLVVQVSASIGIAYGHTANLTASDLMTLADNSLYSAKHAGRNTYKVAVHDGAATPRPKGAGGQPR